MAIQLNQEDQFLLEEITRKVKSEEGWELCVVCWEETEYTIIDSIKERDFYMEGSGQLCRICGHKFC